ncbi:type II secretion system F family protein [Catenuloplanes indicus]|uniref:Tight adherence protein B n=1 Tax=Catenuloplanes indicus TaxID=137267 RepID=A0AAE3W106_9ACTN|nr:type II secretion system F family protein [Catenuloplanes indicus]MDQ0367703.1 tight adherence protein B [Catenuloplanes indicus]
MIDSGTPAFRIAMAALVFLALLAIFLLIFSPMFGLVERRRRMAQVEEFASAVRADRSTAPRPASPFARVAVSAAEQVVRTRGWEERIGHQLDRAGLKLRPSEWLLARIGVALGLAVVLTLLAGPLGFLLGAFLGVLATELFQRHLANRREERFAAALPDSIQMVIGSLRSGFSLQQALDAMVRESVDPLAGEFSRALAEARLGMELEEALDRVAKRMHNKDLAWTVIAMRVQREVGGNLAEVLSNTITTIRERELLRGHVRALSAEGRLSAWVLLALPIVLGAFMFLSRREYVAPLFTDPRGVLMLIAGVVLVVLGGFWLTRVVKVEV